MGGDPAGAVHERELPHRGPRVVGEQDVDRLLRGGGELVTIVSGADDAEGAVAAHLATWIEQHHPLADVVVYDGGQERYPLLVAVE